MPPSSSQDTAWPRLVVPRLRGPGPGCLRDGDRLKAELQTGTARFSPSSEKPGFRVRGSGPELAPSAFDVRFSYLFKPGAVAPGGRLSPVLSPYPRIEDEDGKPDERISNPRIPAAARRSSAAYGSTRTSSNQAVTVLLTL